MQRNHIASVAVFIAAFLGATLVMRTSSADAAWRRQAAAGTCRILYNSTPAYNGPEIQSNSVNFLYVACPAVDLQTVFPKSGVNTLNIAVTNNHSSLNVYAGACVTYESSDGGTCGSLSSHAGSSYHGEFGVSDLTAWSGSPSSDFGYVLVEVPPPDSGNLSGLRGFCASTSDAGCP